jgi:transposase
MTNTKTYPSDITREQFAQIRLILEGARKRTHPRTYDLYDVWNGLNYLLKTGCQWRAIPHEYPKWRTIHEYFSIWKITDEKGKQSVLDQALKKIGRVGTYKKWQKMYDNFSYH